MAGINSSRAVPADDLTIVRPEDSGLLVVGVGGSALALSGSGRDQYVDVGGSVRSGDGVIRPQRKLCFAQISLRDASIAVGGSIQIQTALSVDGINALIFQSPVVFSQASLTQSDLVVQVPFYNEFSGNLYRFVSAIVAMTVQGTQAEIGISINATD